jgi:hypothetical protein
MPTGRGLDIAALVSWLVTEALGGIMLRGWLARGGSLGLRRRPGQAEGMSLPLLAAHAGLNLVGLLFWILFLLSGARVLAWVALGFMGPAIGLGISTVTIWTPYPGSRPKPDEQPAVVPDELVKRALDDEALGQKLVDELLDRNLAQPSPRSVGWSLRPLIPVGHGALAILTFMLATLAAIAAI